MLRELVAARARDLLQGALERRVVEHLDAPALIADEVVMVLAAREGGLEARDTAAENDAMDESEIRELLEHAVDARDADALAVVSEPVEQLLSGEAAVLALQVGDHLVASTAGSGA